MTVPGGVPNLPPGALTVDTLASSTQDMTGDAMKSRAVARFPSIFNSSTGLDPALDITPFGILTRIWAEVNSLIANADPADIQGPEDLPALVLEFIEGLPVIGQFVGVLEAILGTYEGDDPILLQVQAIFEPIRKLMQLVSGIGGGFPTLAELTSGWADVPLLSGDWIGDLLGLLGSPTGVGSGTPAADSSGYVPIFGGLLKGLFGGFAGIFDQEAPTQVQVGESAEGLANSVAGANSAILQINAAIGGGTTDSDEFEFSNGSSWGADWRIMKSAGGTASVDGHNAVYTASYGVDEEIIALRLLKQASGDFQTGSVACATAGGAITDGNAACDIWLRCTDFITYATATGLRMRFWANKALEIAWFTSGAKTVITTGTSSVNLSATSVFAFDAGSAFNANKYIAKVNNTPVIDFTDSVARGLGNRRRGVGLRGEFSLIFFPPLEMQPPKLKQFTATG